MKKLIILASLITTPAMAGWCNQIGQVTQCFNDRGDITTLNRVGNTYLGQTDHRNGRTTYENYQLYNYNNNSGSNNRALNTGDAVGDRILQNLLDGRP